MAEPDLNRKGLIGALRQLTETVLAVVQNRLELAAAELSEEKYRLINVLCWGAVFFFLTLMAVWSLTVGVIILCFTIGETMGIIAATLFVLAYLLAAGAVYVVLRQRLKQWPAPFTHTIAEIKKDRQCLEAPK
jgi:uncharacterized membrane protein YqjE